MSDASSARDAETASAPSRPPRLPGLGTIVLLIAIVGAVTGLAIFPRLTPDPELIRTRATKAAAAGNWTEAELALNRLRDPNPADRLLQAVVAVELKKYEAAGAYLDQVAPDPARAARAALLRGRIELGLFHAARAEDALRLAIQLDPKFTEPRRLLIYLYGVQGRRQELLEQFSALSDQQALNFDSVRHWCIAHQETIQEPEKLRSDLEQFVERDPNDRWSKLGLANVYRQLRLFDQALGVIADLPASDADVQASRAEIEFDRGDLAAVSRILATSPQDRPRLARLRGRLASARQDWPGAVRHFRAAEDADPNHAETIYGLARALQMAGDRAAAAPYLQRGAAIRALRNVLEVARDPDPKAACAQLAAACEAAGYLPEARACYRVLISLDPLNKQAQQAVFRLSSAELGSGGVAATRGGTSQ